MGYPSTTMCSIQICRNRTKEPRKASCEVGETHQPDCQVIKMKQKAKKLFLPTVKKLGSKKEFFQVDFLFHINFVSDCAKRNAFYERGMNCGDRFVHGNNESKVGCAKKTEIESLKLWTFALKPSAIFLDFQPNFRLIMRYPFSLHCVQIQH